MKSFRALKMRAAAIPPFDPATLFGGGVQGAWYDPSDLSSMWQDSGGTTPAAVDSPVGKVNDKSGNGHHLTQGTAAARPMLRQSGALYYLEFDGVDDELVNASGPAATQPWERVSSIRQITWTANEWLFANSSNNIGILFQGEGAASPNIGIYDGGGVIYNSGLAVSADGVVEEKHDGANSRVKVNSGAYSTGNTGTTNPPSSLEIGNNFGGTASNLRLYSFIMRNGTMSADQLNGARAYAALKAGVTL